MSGMQSNTQKKHLSAKHVFEHDELPEGVSLPPEEDQATKTTASEQDKLKAKPSKTTCLSKLMCGF